jgi:hypothetical protein
MESEIRENHQVFRRVHLRDEIAYPVAEELTGQGIPFVFATGYGAEVIPPRFAHISRWEKPFDEHLLLGTVASLCSCAR